jgi:hypothetical protein
MLFWSSFFREINSFRPLSLQKIVILALYFGTPDVFSTSLQHFVKLRGNIVIFLLGDRNCNVLKVKGSQMHLSLIKNENKKDYLSMFQKINELNR